MARILVQVITGPSDATKAALGLLVAKTVIAEGHQLVLFVAGDGVHLLTRAVAEATEGLGTGKVAEHIEAINQGGCEAYFSGMSAKARGIEPGDVILRGATAAMPARLVQLSLECDRVLCF